MYIEFKKDIPNSDGSFGYCSLTQDVGDFIFFFEVFFKIEYKRMHWNFLIWIFFSCGHSISFYQLSVFISIPEKIEKDDYIVEFLKSTFFRSSSKEWLVMFRSFDSSSPSSEFLNFSFIGTLTYNKNRTIIFVIFKVCYFTKILNMVKKIFRLKHFFLRVPEERYKFQEFILLD